MFSSNGLWARTIRVPFQPLGISYDDESGYLYVADNRAKAIVVFKI
jgi:DNA-binding beta-propeller fold protein YncE